MSTYEELKEQILKNYDVDMLCEILGIDAEPIERTYDTYGYEGVKHSIYTKVDKYLTRNKGTDRVDITKAIHCLELQLGFYDLAHDDTLDVLQSQFTFEAIDKGTVEEQELREGIDTYPNYEFEAKGNV